MVISGKSAASEAFAALSLITIAILVIGSYRGCPAYPGTRVVSRMPFESIRVSTHPLPEGVKYGNGHLDGRDHKGWFVGHFMGGGESDLAKSKGVEAKLSFNPTGKRNEATTLNEFARTMTFLISGSHKLEFGNSSVLLERPGDYCIFANGVAHSWVSVEDSSVLTVRWPSLHGDQKKV